MNPTQQFELKLTVEQINVISQGLHELPAKICNPIMYEINKQIIAQQTPVPLEE